MKKYFYSLGGLALFLGLIANFVSLPTTQAQSPPSGPSNPEVYLIQGDSHSSSPSLPGSCTTVSGPGPSVYYSGDADCLVIGISNQSAVYTQDFRLRFAMDQGIIYTPWASEGGGFSGLYVNGNAFHGAAVIVEYRTPPVTGMYFTNVRVGVQLFYRSDNGGCGPSSGMGWAYGTPGQPNQSPYWSYGAPKDDDPGCGMVALQATPNLPNDADFYSEDVADTVNTNTAASGTIVMKNLGATWVADQEDVSARQGDCSNWVPTSVGQTCVENRTFYSSNFQLVRKDTNNNISAPAQLPFKKQITYTYSGTEYQWCEPPSDPPPRGGGGGGGIDIILDPIVLDNVPQQGFFAKVKTFIQGLIPKAFAQISCTTELVVTVSSSESQSVIYNQQANFPITINSGNLAGTYTLEYRMKQLTSIPNGNSAGEFGESATVTVNVQGAGDYYLQCTPEDLGTVNYDSQGASFSVIARQPQSGAAYNGNVTLSGQSEKIDANGNVLGAGNLSIGFQRNPVNPSAASPNNATQVSLAGFTPGTTYRITVSGDPAISGDESCQAILRVNNAQENGSQFVSQTIPKTTLYSSEQMTVSIRMKNARPDNSTNNLTSWDVSNEYALGSETPRNNNTWGWRRVTWGSNPVTPPSVLPALINPGQEATFTFTITAPTVTTQQSFTFQWGMVLGYYSGEPDASSWFDTGPNGEMTDPVTITVVPRTYSLLCTPGEINYRAGDPAPKANVRATTTTDYNGNVALSAVSNPTGLTFSYNSQNINPSGPTTNTDVTVSGMQPNMDYTVTFSGQPSANGNPSTCPVVIHSTGVSLTGLSIAPSSSTISVGSTQAYVVTAQYSDGSTQNVTNQSTYQSSQPAVASIPSNSPVATGASVGNTTITATYTEGSTTLQAQAALSVQSSGGQSYYLSCLPDDMGTVQVGDMDPIFNVQGISDNGYSGYVDLSADAVDLKTGDNVKFTYNFSNNPVLVGSKKDSVTDISISDWGTPGIYLITVTGSPAINGVSPTCQARLEVADNVDVQDATVSFRCDASLNGAYSSNNCTVTAGSVGYLKWTSTNSDSCSVYPTEMMQTVTTNPNPSSGIDTKPLTSDQSFTITCTSNSNGLPANGTVNFTVTGGLPTLNTSSKYIVAVNGVPVSPAPSTCQASSPNLSQLFKDGDLLTFRMDVCNTGPVDLDADVTLTDSLSFLNKPSSAQGGWNVQFSCNNGCENDPANLDESQYASNKILKFLFERKPGAAPTRKIPANNGVWSVTYQAVIKAPTPATLPYYRFLNCVNDITVSPASIPKPNAPNMCMLPYPFVLSGSPPDRHEIAP